MQWSAQSWVKWKIAELKLYELIVSQRDFHTLLQRKVVCLFCQVEISQTTSLLWAGFSYHYKVFNEWGAPGAFIMFISVLGGSQIFPESCWVWLLEEHGRIAPVFFCIFFPSSRELGRISKNWDKAFQLVFKGQVFTN